MTRFRVVPEQSQIWIEARSDLHPIRGERLRLEGQAEVELQDDGRPDLRVPPTGRVELPVERLSSGKALQDQEMWRRIEAKKFPTITVELRQVTARSEPNRFVLRSDLTFHGVARRIPVEVTATLDAERVLHVDGEFTLDVRAFALIPPRVLGM